MIHAVSREDAKSLERIEIAAFCDFYRAAPSRAVKTLGVRLVACDPMLVAMAPGLDVLAFNRAIGYGLQPKIDPDDVDRYTDHFRSGGVKRYFVQMCPVTAPSNARRELQARGLHWYNNWVKLHRNAAPAPAVDTPLKVREIDRAHALRFGEIVCNSFGWGEETVDWVAALVGRPHWQIYGAFDNSTLAATAAMYTNGSYAWLDFAATDEGYRGSGAQTALLATRINDARNAGIETLVVETAEETNDRLAPSFRNVQRQGFNVAYVRPNFMGAGIN